MTAAAPSTDVSPAPRMLRFREAVKTIRARSRRSGGAEHWLFVAGSFLMPFGLVLVLLGWWGASRTPFVFEQIPYLISGGLFGTGLAAAGGLCYFAYWQARTAVEQRQHLHELIESVGRLQTTSAQQLAAVQRLADLQQPSVPDTELVSTARGNMVHDPSCRVVAGRDDLRVVDDPEGRPVCSRCRPTVG